MFEFTFSQRRRVKWTIVFVQPRQFIIKHTAQMIIYLTTEWMGAAWVRTSWSFWVNSLLTRLGQSQVTALPELTCGGGIQLKLYMHSYWSPNPSPHYQFLGSTLPVTTVNPKHSTHPTHPNPNAVLPAVTVNLYGSKAEYKDGYSTMLAFAWKNHPNPARTVGCPDRVSNQPHQQTKKSNRWSQLATSFRINAQYSSRSLNVRCSGKWKHLRKQHRVQSELNNAL